MPTGLETPPTAPPATKSNAAAINDLRGTILTCVDVAWEPLTIPEWNVTLLIRSGTGEKRADLLDAAITFDEHTEKSNVDLKKIYPDLVIHSALDPTGVPGVDAEALLACKPEDRGRYAEAVGNAQPLFTLLDREALLGKNGAALERVGKVASKLWGLDKEAEKAAEKNSDGTPSVAPTSGS